MAGGGAPSARGGVLPAENEAGGGGHVVGALLAEGGDHVGGKGQGQLLRIRRACARAREREGEREGGREGGRFPRTRVLARGPEREEEEGNRGGGRVPYL